MLAWKKGITAEVKEKSKKFLRLLRRDEKGIRRRHFSAFLAGYQSVDVNKTEWDKKPKKAAAFAEEIRNNEIDKEKMLDLEISKTKTGGQKRSDVYEALGICTAIVIQAAQYMLRLPRLNKDHREVMAWLIGDYSVWLKKKLKEHDLEPSEDLILGLMHDLHNIPNVKDNPEKEEFIAHLAAAWK